MKNGLVISVLLIMCAAAWAGKPTPNPAEYTIAVHVQSSRLGQHFGYSDTQVLSVSINGKHYELSSNDPAQRLLRAGDYKAKIISDDEKRSYEYWLKYEFLFPDGTTREFIVVGEGE